MAISSFFTALLSLAAISNALPTSNSLEVQGAALEQFQQTVDTVVETKFAPQACEDVYLIFARGTFEPEGRKFTGVVVGNPLVSALQIGLANVKFDFAGVDYSNGAAGYLAGGDSAGISKMAKMIADKVSQCPNIKLVVSGYSQGAQLVHGALEKTSASVKKNVIYVVTFGDPLRDTRRKLPPGIDPSNMMIVCAKDDNICTGGINFFGAHLQYGGDAAKFQEIVQAVKSRL